MSDAPDVDEARQPGKCRQHTFDRGAPLFGVRPRLGIGDQATLGLGEALLEEVGSLAEAGGAHLEVAASAAEHRRPGIEPGAQLVPVARRLGLGRLARLELGHHRLQLGDPPPFGGHQLGELVAAGGQRLLLDDDLAPLRLQSGERLGCRREAAIVCVEALGDLRRMVPCGYLGARRRRLGGPGLGQRPLGGEAPGVRILQGGGCDAPGRSRADPPESRSQPFSRWRDDDPMRSGERCAGGVREAVDTARRRQQAVEQTLDVGDVSR